MILATILAALCGIVVGTAPFALISDVVEAAIVAGVFSVINTVLNIILIRRQTTTVQKLDDVEVKVQRAAKVAEIIPLRKGDLETNPQRREEDK